MDMPEEVKERINFLNLYKINNKLDCGSVFHLYPTKIAYPDGYYDAYFFDLHVFNKDTMEKRIIKDRDGIKLFNTSNKDITHIGIYADK